MITFRDPDFLEDPYPGARPPFSYVHEDGGGESVAGWPVAELDAWLRARSAAPVADRLPLLAYGSNVNPAKITWLRAALGLPGPVVVLRARCVGLAAVWAAHLRVRDDQRPATLLAEHHRIEWHGLWLATPEQIRVLDVCEGRGERYRLVRLRSGTITTEDGMVVDRPLAYTARNELRSPLYVDGVPVRCADVPQAAARGLVGVPGPDGLAVDPVADGWP